MNRKPTATFASTLAIVILTGVILGQTPPASAAPATEPVSAPAILQPGDGDEAMLKTRLAPQIDAAVAAPNYYALESLASSLRNSRAETADGTWHLLVFYQLLTFDRLAPGQPSAAAWEPRLNFLQAWTSARPKSITARVALASFYVNYAWLAHGHGDASTVSVSDKQLFNQRIGKALQVLVEAQVITNQCPVSWDIMQQIRLSQGSDLATAKQNFDQAIAHEPRYTRFYVNHVNYLLPRSFGDEGDWEKFATKSADALGGDQGDILYARLGWWVQQQNLYNDFFKDTGYDWPRVKNGMTLILQQYPDSTTATNEFACLAFLAGDKPCARPLFEHLGPNLDPAVWGHDQARFLRMRKWALDQ